MKSVGHGIGFDHDLSRPSGVSRSANARAGHALTLSSPFSAIKDMAWRLQRGCAFGRSSLACCSDACGRGASTSTRRLWGVRAVLQTCSGAGPHPPRPPLQRLIRHSPPKRSGDFHPGFNRITISTGSWWPLGLRHRVIARVDSPSPDNSYFRSVRRLFPAVWVMLPGAFDGPGSRYADVMTICMEAARPCAVTYP